MKKAILDFLKAHGFSGDENSPWEDVRRFLDGLDVEPEFIVAGRPVNVEKAWRAKTVTISVTADAGEDVQVVDGSKEQTEEEEVEETEEAKAARKALAEAEAEIRRLTSKAAYREAQAVARGRTPAGLTPENHRRMSERKTYDRAAASGAAWKGNRRTAFQSADEAEQFGAWFRTTILEKMASDFDHEIVRKANISTVYTAGGALIPEGFNESLIDLKEERGIAREIMGTIPMQRDVEWTSRLTGGLTVYSPGQGNTISESNPTFDSVRLVAVEMATMTTVSRTLMMDSPIAFGDIIAREIAYAFADKEDEMVFNGDGTSDYFGVVGFARALKDKSSVVSEIAGLVVGTGNAYSELTLSDFQAVVGRAPSYVDRGSPFWVMHKRFFYEVCVRLAQASGGVTQTEVINGIRTPIFEGYPVRFAQVMPRVAANSQVCALFGEFGMAGKIGEVRGSMEIARSNERYFDQAKIAIRGLQRVAVNIHDVGNASATEADREPGPVVGLITAAS